LVRTAIGATRNDGSGNLLSASGHVRVYDLSGGSWTQVGADIDGEAADDYSGWSVAMSADGSRIAIGAFANDGSGNSLSASGHVRVYDLSGGSWIQVGADIDGEAAGDQSGYSVAMSADGSRIAIGAIANDGSGNLFNDSGHVRVYRDISYQPEEETQQSGDICFPAGTPVRTDQGEIPIEKLTSENTIDGVNVVAVVPVYNECDYLVKINKHALGPNYPKKTTLISRNHRVYLNKKREETIPALALYNGKTITVVQREIHETIYNVLLPTYSKMTINGLVVETLHPKSVYARKM
jgi:hypothetical protein